MEEEKLQNENTPKGSPQENEDKEEYHLQTPVWYRPDNERQDSKRLKKYARKGEKLSEELTRSVTIITEKKVKMQYTMELLQETEDVLRLGLIQLRINFMCALSRFGRCHETVVFNLHGLWPPSKDSQHLWPCTHQ